MLFLRYMRPESVQQLHANWIENENLKATRKARDFKPVCKLFTPWVGTTFLLTELQPDSALCFGLADTGAGFPELGYFDLNELFSVKGPGGLRIEEDLHFSPSKTLSEYADEARSLGYIKA